MLNPRKQNASGKGGAKFTKLAGGVNGQSKIFECSANHISKVVRELQANGVGLQSTAGATQITMLRRALEFRGAKGLNTYEGTAAGYARLATRIQDLEADGWLIASQRENLIGPDGLYHGGVARYVLIGRRHDAEPAGRGGGARNGGNQPKTRANTASRVVLAPGVNAQSAQSELALEVTV